MNWEMASAIAEVIAAVAVVVSLWYLAIQLKQSTELARADLEVQLGVIWAEMHDNMIQNPALARAYDLAENNWSEMHYSLKPSQRSSGCRPDVWPTERSF